MRTHLCKNVKYKKCSRVKKISLQSGLTFLHIFYLFFKISFFLFVFITMLVVLYVSKLWMSILMDRWSSVKGPFGIEGEYRFVYERMCIYVSNFNSFSNFLACVFVSDARWWIPDRGQLKIYHSTKLYRQ